MGDQPAQPEFLVAAEPFGIPGQTIQRERPNNVTDQRDGVAELVQISTFFHRLGTLPL
jgi:hypothetical protein